MVQASKPRSISLTHHLEAADEWLAGSESGSDARALSYAGFELRLAIERLAVHYWLALRPSAPSADEIKAFSFKKVEQRIYELAGHQLKINRQFEFMQTVLEALKIDLPLPTPDIRTLSKHWHETSDLCHVLWTFASQDDQLMAEIFSKLHKIRGEVARQMTGLAGFPRIDSPEFAKLQTKFIEGDASTDDIRAFLARGGAWAVARYPDGRPSTFVGTPIPPSTP